MKMEMKKKKKKKKKRKSLEFSDQLVRLQKQNCFSQALPEVYNNMHQLQSTNKMC